MIVVDPVFSVAERNRRWDVVRDIMARPRWNLDAIIAPEVGDRSYCQYLSSIGGRNGSADIVFPRDPAKPVYAFPGPGGYAPGPVDIRTAIWRRKLAPWCADGKLVIQDGEGSKSVLGCLKALGLSGAGKRIGIAKLAGSRFDAEGLVPSTFLENLKSGLPGVIFLPIEQWGPDSGPVDEAAMVKGPEEQEVIRQCVAAGEKGIATLLRVARPPAKRQAEIWLPTMMAMFKETGEEPGRASISLNVPSNSTLGAPTDDPLEPGTIISEEIEACLQGYKAQVNHSIFLGGEKTPGFDYYKAAMEVVIKLFFDTLALVVPGTTTCGQFVDHYSELVKSFNAEEREGGVAIHTSGLGGLMRPRVGPANSRKESDIVLMPGMTFDFKPTVRLGRSAMKDVGENNRTVQIGEHVLITDTGYVRLGKRELKPLFTGVAS